MTNGISSIKIKQTNVYIEHPEVAMTYFEPDDKKDGGKYIAYIGRLCKIDCEEKVLIFEENKSILLDNIIKIVI